jgi:hypothetical protein
MGWRGLATLLGAVALVITLGILLGALFSREAVALIRLLWQGFVLALALIVVPIVYLFAGLLEQIIRLLGFGEVFNRLPDILTREQPILDQSPAALGGLPFWLQMLIRGFCAIVPVLIIIALFFLIRNRTRRREGAEEERESLWSWSTLADDLRGLLAGRRRAQPGGGLRAALAALRGSDPASRVRRSYIRLLLLGEARERPRPAPQTPHEYASAAGALLPTAAQPVDTLTVAYEQARYNPQGVTAADAEAAERAWAAIEQADRRST